MHIIRNTKQIYRHVDNVNVSGGHFVTAKSVYYQTPAPPLETLYKHCAPGALLDSAERFDPPKCDENTRVAIIKTIMDWITGGGDSSSILWLHGPAGAGKSALAQTIAELCKEQDLLAAVFFFARNSPDRANGRLLIATLVHQLTSTFPRTRSYIQKSIHRDESVFDRNISSQAEDLLVLPIKKFRGSLRQLLRRIFLQSKHPRLIVIDGLDECNDADVQTEILKAIAESSRKLRFPFRFLIASRPESHIRSAFDHHPSLDAAYVTRFDLVDVLDIEKDIKTYLTSEFKKIRNEHQLRNHIPASWPQDSEIDTLVERASGQFIYASTIMKYIQSSKHRPTDRLRVILGLYAKPASDTPYASLDALYTHIFHSVDDIFRVMQIFGALVIPRTVDDGLGTFNTPEMLDKLLCFQPGDTELILSDLLSIVRLDDHTSPIRLHHASLGDFLLDPSRSGPVGLFVEKRQVHERLARGYLHLLQGVVVPSYHSANDKEFDSYLTSFRMNYDRAIFSANLLNDLLHAKFIAIFRYFCARTTPEIPESISITMKSTDAETMQSFWKMRNLWRSRGMDQLFHPFTRQEIGSVSCEKILDAYLQDLDDHCRLDDNLHEALDTLLSQPRFQDYIFRVCDHTNGSLCKRCQGISPLAPALSYRLLYTDMLYQPTLHANRFISDEENQFGTECARRAYVCLTFVFGVINVIDAIVTTHNSDEQLRAHKAHRVTERRERIKTHLQLESCIDFFFEASLDCASILLSYSDYSKSLADLLSKNQIIQQLSTLEQEYTLRRFGSQFNALKSEIVGYLRRVSTEANEG